MSDAICRKCGEPWELYYLAHEGLYDFPGQHAPERMKNLHDDLVAADDAWHDRKDLENPDALDPRPSHYELGGKELQHAVMRGEGCPACWEDPSRATMDEDESLDALRHNLFDSNWDGDPAELL
jgi:hypothetical protein